MSHKTITKLAADSIQSATPPTGQIDGLKAAVMSLFRRQSNDLQSAQKKAPTESE